MAFSRVARNSFRSRQVSLIRPQVRRNTSNHFESQGKSQWLALVGGLALGAAAYATQGDSAEEKEVDYDKVRRDISNLLDDSKWEDGSWGPIFVRLAWHAAGTYDKETNTGGSDGSTMRFQPESHWSANGGLHHARARLESVKQKHPGISYSDLWSLAAAVAIEHMGGPKINWRPGRSDKEDGRTIVPDGRLPDAKQGSQHVRDIFYRMGFNDREIVALSGAHALGRCHRDRSGFEGPWTHSPTVFSNDYFVQLLETKWTKKNWDGPEQFEDPSKTLMMLPSDLALINDAEFRKYVEIYAEDEEVWFRDFSQAFQKLEELGVNFKESKPWYKFW